MNVPIKRGTARRLGLKRPPYRAFFLGDAFRGAIVDGEGGYWLRTDTTMMPITIDDVSVDADGVTATCRPRQLRGPTEERTVQTWSGGEWVKTGDHIDYRPVVPCSPEWEPTAVFSVDILGVLHSWRCACGARPTLGGVFADPRNARSDFVAHVMRGIEAKA